ncbi:hypothetical protein Gorai_020608 [Gossypium raimondii]|uniref:Bidirectional sugar transporter SWEET n=1 Tax=Gossypium raimondii TaxID=29730 RepID=A0A7J8NN83_GOSRA|nr:hypothetical protein [Gossypium raimondii]
MALHLSWVFVFGILGTYIYIYSYSLLLCMPTFYQIYKKKTSEGFQSLPYVVSLFSAMLWIYYALLKKDAMLLITINTFCCFIQSFYIVTYFYYGRKKEKVNCGKFSARNCEAYAPIQCFRVRTCLFLHLLPS